MLGGLVSVKNRIRIGIGQDHLATLVTNRLPAQVPGAGRLAVLGPGYGGGVAALPGPHRAHAGVRHAPRLEGGRGRQVRLSRGRRNE